MKFFKIKDEFNGGFKVVDVCYKNINVASLSRILYKGTYIDIFILDYAKVGSSLTNKIRAMLGRFLQIAKLDSNEKSMLYSHFSDKFLKKMIVHLSDILRIVFGSAKVEQWNYDLLVSDKKSDKLVIIEQPEVLYDRDWFKDTIEVKFEDQMFLASKQYEKLLHSWYGDYMQIPKEGILYLEEEKRLKNQK